MPDEVAKPTAPAVPVAFTFEQYLAEAVGATKTTHKLTARVSSKGVVSFYIHASGAEGSSRDFVVTGNTLKPTE